MKKIEFISRGVNKNMIVEYSPLLDEAIDNFKNYGVLRFIGNKVFILQCASFYFKQIVARSTSFSDVTIINKPCKTESSSNFSKVFRVSDDNISI